MKRALKAKNKMYFEWGVLISIIGIPVSLIIKELIGEISFDLTNLVFIISLILIPDYANLMKFRFPSLNRKLLVVFIFQIYILSIATIKGVKLLSGGGDSLVFTIYIMILIIGLSTRNREIKSEYFIKITWWVTGIFNFLLFYIVTNKFTNFNEISFAKLETGGDRLSISNIVFIHLIVMLIYKPKNKLLSALKSLFIILCIYIIIFFFFSFSFQIFIFPSSSFPFTWC